MTLNRDIVIQDELADLPSAGQSEGRRKSWHRPPKLISHLMCRGSGLTITSYTDEVTGTAVNDNVQRQSSNSRDLCQAQYQDQRNRVMQNQFA